MRLPAAVDRLAPGHRSRAVAPRARLSPRQVAAVRQAASLLLGYPDDDLRARLPVVRAAVDPLPGPVRAGLLAAVDHLERADPVAAAAGYVDTFDLRRRTCLYLTYFSYGDTRKRGMGLLRFRHAYRAAGVELGMDGGDGAGEGGELPDHLAVVLEFAATVDPQQGQRLLMEHRAAVELIRRALRESGTPTGSVYAGVLDAVAATLPPLADRDDETVRRLAAQGPPAEEVGLEPFALDPLGEPERGGRR